MFCNKQNFIFNGKRIPTFNKNRISNLEMKDLNMNKEWSTNFERIELQFLKGRMLIQVKKENIKSETMKSQFFEK